MLQKGANSANIAQTVQVRLDNWFARNVEKLAAIMRVVFGLIWAVDASFKFTPNFVQGFPDMISSAADNQPSWLSGWFSFWSTTTSSNPAFFAYSIAALELFLAFCLLAGFLRKFAYTVGFFYSLVLWSVPEGFGGPYGPSSTDIGTGVIYAFVFIFLLLINATFGTSRYSLDRLMERKWPGWKRIAEIRSSVR